MSCGSLLHGNAVIDQDEYYPESFSEASDLVARSLGRTGGLSDLIGADVESLLDKVIRAQPGAATRRVRRLPPDVVVWIVVGMALFRSLPIVDVMRRLSLYLGGSKAPVSGALAMARAALGAEPVKALFEELGLSWGHDSVAEVLWKGMLVYAFDGTTFSVPDTPENLARFGKPSGGRDGAGYPKVRAVVLEGARSRLLVDACLGPYSGKGNGEASLAAPLWDGIPDNGILLFDRGFIHIGRMKRYVSEGTNRHLVTRERAKINYEVLQELGRGESLIRFEVPPAERIDDSEEARYLILRRITYREPGFAPSAVWTSLRDPKTHPAKSVLALYHERWQVELTYRDVKVSQLNREEALRSKTPDNVEQEIWGVLTAYQLVRKRMFKVAVEHNVPPSRMGFKGALAAVRFFCSATAWAAVPEIMPKLLNALDGAILEHALPPLKRRPSYPRAVKVKMSNYARNRGTTKSDSGRPGTAK